jgi:hypothetical protein
MFNLTVHTTGMIRSFTVLCCVAGSLVPVAVAAERTTSDSNAGGDRPATSLSSSEQRGERGKGPQLPSFKKAFPAAAKLCAAKPDNTDLQTACGALKVSFTAAEAPVKALLEAQRAALKTQKAAIKAACADEESDACKSAKTDAKSAREAARVETKAAIKTMNADFQTARTAFWEAAKAAGVSAGDKGQRPKDGNDGRERPQPTSPAGDDNPSASSDDNGGQRPEGNRGGQRPEGNRGGRR